MRRAALTPDDVIEVPTPILDAIFAPRTPAQIAPDPERTTPNGYCVECGIRIAKWNALRCRPHANPRIDRSRCGRFTSDLARRAIQAKVEKWRRERTELAQYREQWPALLERVRQENEQRRAEKRAYLAARQQAAAAPRDA